MPQCSAFGCKTRDVVGERKKGVTFHRFPQRDSGLLREWVTNMKRGDWVPSERSLLCSEHFTSDCFDKTGQTVRLREGAVPTIFGFSKKNTLKVTKISTDEKLQQQPRKRGRPKLTDEERERKSISSKIMVKAISFESKGKKNVKAKKTSFSTDEFTEIDTTDLHNIKQEKDDDCTNNVDSNEEELPRKRIRKPTYKIRVKQEQISDEGEDLEDSDIDGEYVPEKPINTARVYEEDEPNTENNKKHSRSPNKMTPKEEVESVTVSSLPGGKDKIIQLPDNRTYFEFAVPKKKVILQLKAPNDIAELKTQNLDEVINSLKVRQMISNNAQELLDSFGDLPEAMIKVGTKVPIHSEEVKKFATTLYLCSPRGYDLLSTVFCFPDKMTIQGRLQDKGFWPGFTQEALEILTNKNLQNSVDKVCSIMFEFISIRKQCVLDRSSDRWIGHVDFCGGQNPHDSDGIPHASEILTFTAVGIGMDWKLPFGYFPVSKLSGEELHHYVCEAITVLEECGLDVRAIVCEGTGSTINMGRIFGCNIRTRSFTELVTCFPHPSKPQRKMHLLFSIRQSFQLLQNLLSYKGVLRSSTYGIIKWKYFAQIFGEKTEKQQTFNILEPEYVEFYHRLRIIRLCSLGFSCTVSQAFEIAEEIKMQDYKGCDAAGNFAADMYRAFDLLNSRNPVTTGEKPPITTPFLSEQLESLTVIGQRLFGLELPSGKKVIGESRWMSIGLLAFTLKSLSILACELINEKSLTYLSSYRLNFDHSNMILSCIQRKQNWDGIPSVVDFMEGYKKLFNDHIRSSDCKSYANDFDGQDLTIGQGLFSSNQILINSCNKDYFMLHSHYLTDPNSDVTDRARCIIRCISKRLSCTECMSLLLDNDHSHDLQTKKINVQFLRPSNFLISFLQNLETIYKVKFVDEQLGNEYLVLNMFCDYFDLSERTKGIDSYHLLEEPQHIICLIKTIIRNFVECKQHCSEPNYISIMKSRFCKHS